MTIVHSIGQIEFLTVPALGTCLTGVGRIYFHTSSPSPFCLELNEGKKSSPCHVIDRAINAAEIIFFHVVDGKVLNGNRIEFIDKFSRLLVGEVLTFPRNALVNTGNYFPGFYTSLQTFGLFGKFTLRFCKILLFMFEKPRIFYFKSIRQGGECFKPHINTYDGLNRFWLWDAIDHTGKGHIPLSGCRAADCTGFDFTLNGPMQLDLNSTYFGKLDNIFKDLKPGLRIGKRIISKLTPEPRITWLFTSFHPAKERSKGKIDACRYVLKTLTECVIQKLIVFFQHCNCIRLIISGKTFLMVFQRIFTLFKKIVVKPSTGIKRLVQLCSLRAVWKNTIFKGLSHGYYTILQNCVKANHYLKTKAQAFICQLKQAVFPPIFDKITKEEPMRITILVFLSLLMISCASQPVVRTPVSQPVVEKLVVEKPKPFLLACPTHSMTQVSDNTFKLELQKNGMIIATQFFMVNRPEDLQSAMAAMFEAIKNPQDEKEKAGIDEILKKTNPIPIVWGWEHGMQPKEKSTDEQNTMGKEK